MSTPRVGPEFLGESIPPLRKLLYAALATVTVLLGSLALWPNLAKSAFSSNYLPHLYCYLEKPSLVWTHVVADSLIGVSYVAIAGTLAYLIHKGRNDISFRWMFLAFGLFIMACGSTHFMEVVTVWVPVYVLSAAVKVFTAVASVVTAIILPFTVSQVISVVHNAKDSEEHRRLLEAASAERDSAQQSLRGINEDLERRVRSRTVELNDANRNLHAEIEERKRIEEKLAELAAIVEFSDDAILGKTLDGTITTWNRGAERLYGYSAGEAVGQPISFLAPGDRHDEIPGILARIAQGERVEHYETLRIKKGGERLHVSLTVSPVRSNWSDHWSFGNQSGHLG